MSGRRSYYRRRSYYGRRSYYRRRWPGRRKWVGLRRRRWRPIRIQNLSRLTRAALASNVKIFTYCTFPVCMQFLDKIYFGHKAYKYLVNMFRYIQNTKRYKKNTYGSIIPASLTNSIVEVDGADYNENLIEFFKNNIFLSGLGDRLVELLNADQGTETSARSRAIANRLALSLAYMRSIPSFIEHKQEIIDKFVGDLVISPYYHNWPNICGKLGTGRPGRNLPDSVWLDAEVTQNVGNVYQPSEKKPYMYFSPFNETYQSYYVTKADGTTVEIFNRHLGVPVRELNLLPKFGQGSEDAPPNRVQQRADELARAQERHSQNMNGNFQLPTIRTIPTEEVAQLYREGRAPLSAIIPRRQHGPQPRVDEPRIIDQIVPAQAARQNEAEVQGGFQRIQLRPDPAAEGFI